MQNESSDTDDVREEGVESEGVDTPETEEVVSTKEVAVTTPVANADEKYFEAFTINKRKYLFSIRTSRTPNECYLVITEKRAVNGKDHTHRIRVYAEALESFESRLSFFFGKLKEFNKKEE